MRRKGVGCAGRCGAVSRRDATRHGGAPWAGANGGRGATRRVRFHGAAGGGELRGSARWEGPSACAKRWKGIGPSIHGRSSTEVDEDAGGGWQSRIRGWQIRTYRWLSRSGGYEPPGGRPLSSSPQRWALARFFGRSTAICEDDLPKNLARRDGWEDFRTMTGESPSDLQTTNSWEIDATIPVHGEG